MKTDMMDFLVVAKGLNAWWLLVLHGEDKGMRINVPIRHPEYSTEVLQQLSTLETDMYITCTLITHDTDYKKWRVDTIEEIVS